MRDVYSNAACCIAATAADNGSIGLFFDRDTEAMTPVKVELCKAMDAIDARHVTFLDHLCGSYMLQFEKHHRSVMIDNAPLNDRAWVAQERFLSRRIIHFTNEILFWECQESFTSETHPSGHPDPYEVAAGARSLKMLAVKRARRRFANGDNMIGKNIERQDADALYLRWCVFLNFYTSRKLTMGTDALVALDGISQEIAAILQDEMIAGLWKGRLLSELCWRKFGDKPCRPPFPSAPSWSWVSTTGPIITKHGHGYWWSSMAEVQHTRVDLAPSGAFERASLTLRCRLIPISLEGSTAERGYYRVLYHTRFSHFEVYTYLDREVPPDGNIPLESEAFVLSLEYTPSGKYAKGIVVVPWQDPPGGYKRVAYCTMRVPCNLYGNGERERARGIPEVIEELAELQTIELF
jgi:hypothetical protein